MSLWRGITPAVLRHLGEARARVFASLCNISCLIFDFTKAIRLDYLLSISMHEVIVDSCFALINYHLIGILSL